MKHWYQSGKIPQNIIIIGFMSVLVIVIFWHMSKKLEIFMYYEIENQLSDAISMNSFDTNGQ